MHALQATELAQLHEQEVMRAAIMARRRRVDRALVRGSRIGAWWRRLTGRPQPQGTGAPRCGRPEAARG